ncbi:MAG: IPT/TIG domain-containing protein [Myxococcaceae bacterium]
MIVRALVFALVVAVLAACPPPTPMPDGGMTGVTPVLTSIAPDRGPLAGSTTVSLNGTNFVAGATVTFGGVAAPTTFETDKKLTAITPAGATVGKVSVTVTNPGGKVSTLDNAFTYEANVTRTVKNAQLQITDSSDSSGTAMVSATVIATVDVPGVTAGTGQGAGVKAQVGFATSPSPTPQVSEFTWIDASYTGDVDGATSGDKALDGYQGMVTVPGPTTGTQLIYFLAARFSVDNGATWTIADKDGSMNGALTAQLAKLTVTRASVTWCKLGGEVVTAPPMISLRTGATGPTIYAQVYESGVTDQVGAGAGIKGALGYGMAGTDPATWTWGAATFNVDTGGGANDEYQAVLPTPAAGMYKFAFRFNRNDGEWTYCDADGLANGGFTEDQAGSLTVTALGIDSCKLQFPATLTAQTGVPSLNVYGRVFVTGVTEPNGAGAGIEGQVGYGTAMDPTNAGWTWTNATFNMDDGMGGDEYQANFTVPAIGTYSYAYRFRIASGAWTYCDLDTSTNGTQANQLGVMSSVAAVIQSCKLQSVSSFSLASGSPLSASARVFIPTVTMATGAAPNLRVQIGMGPQGDNASTSVLWGWQSATFSSDVTASGEDEWAATTYPAYTGGRAVSARASLDGTNWVYCDLNGSDTGGYEVNQQYDVTVTNHATFSFCNLQSPSMAPVGGTVYGQIYQPPYTPDASTPFIAQLGVGVESEDPGLAWQWSSASFNVLVGNNNEYSRAVPDAGVGKRYAFRYSLDAGVWCYGDIDGSQNGFSGGSNIGTITP